jgi:hypothetical protein
MKASYFWKILLLCSAIALVLATSISYSQGAYHSGIGVKAGLNAASMSDNDANQSDMRIGMHVGFFGSIVITDGLAFQPEFLYTMKGGKMQYQNAFATGSVTFGLDYIEIPLLLAYSLSENLSLHGGVYVASLSKVSITNESSSSLFNFETEIREDDFETIDYGLVIGASTNFDVFSIGARYEYGLATVGKERVFAGRSFHFPDASNSAFQIYFAVTLLP